MRFGSLAFGWGVGWGAGDDQHAHFIRFFHPSTDRFEGGHHVSIQGIQLVRPVNGHASDVTNVLILADWMEFNLHDLTLWGVHGLTEGPPLLDVIASLQ